jgi:hypothetical protein
VRVFSGARRTNKLANLNSDPADDSEIAASSTPEAGSVAAKITVIESELIPSPIAQQQLWELLLASPSKRSLVGGMLN